MISNITTAIIDYAACFCPKPALRRRCGAAFCRLIFFCCGYGALLPFMCTQVKAQEFIPRFSFVLNDVPLPEIDLKCEGDLLLSRSDSLIQIAGQDTSLQVTKTNFTYEGSWLSKWACLTNFESTDSTIPVYNALSTTYFFYNGIYRCIFNEIEEHNYGPPAHYRYGKRLKLGLLNLNENGSVDSGLFINHDRYLHVPRNSESRYQDMKIPRYQDSGYLYNYEKIPFYRLLKYPNNTRYLFRTPSIAKFFEENQGFPDIKNPLLQKKDFYLPKEKDDFWDRSGKKDQFFKVEGGTLFQIDRKSGRFISAYYVKSRGTSGPWRIPVSMTYFRFNYRPNTLIIESISFDIDDPDYKALVSLFYSIYGQKAHSLEKVDKQFEQLLKTEISQRMTIQFQKNRNIKGLLVENFINNNAWVKETIVECSYKDDFLSTIIVEKPNGSGRDISYSRRKINLVYNK